MENVENINEDQPKSSNKKKKTLLLILLLLLLVLIGIAIALPLLLIKDEVKISDLKLEQNVFKYNENYLNAKVYVFYDDDSEKEITLNDTYISQEDKEKFNIVGENHQITLTYENFSKTFYITIVEAEFSPSEIDNLVYSDQIVEFNTKGWFFPVTNLPEGASVSYNIEGIIENQASYSLIEPGTYIIEAIISKPNYKSLNINFTIKIVDTSISIENFEKIEDMYFTNVSADTTYIDFTKIVKINDKEGVFEIFADENLSTKFDKTNITINAGENHYYLKVFFEDNSITKVYDIVIYKNGMFNIKFILNSETLDEYQIEENKMIEQPALSKEGYIITGWKVDDELISFPYKISANTTFDAVYQLIDYNIQKSITGEGSIKLSKELANVGDEILITCNPNLGYEISKIYYKIDGQDQEIEIENNKFVMPAKNIIVYAEFVKINYAILKDGVTNGDFTVSKDSACFGEDISVSFMPNPGYELEEVYYIIEGGQEKIVIENSHFIMPIGNITIYVKYIPITYNITLILNDGIIEGEEIIYYTVESETFTLNKPTKEGYSFLGWSSDEIEIPQEEIVIEKGTIGNKEYIANWTINTYSITKGEMLNGSLEVVQSAQFNSSVTISINPDEGYELDKVYYKENDEGNEITIYGNSFNMPANNVTIYATFKAIEYDISKVEAENGTFNISQSVGIIGDVILITPKPNEGFQLEKIYYLINNEGEEILVLDNKFNMPANDVTIYVLFEKIDYTISKSEEVNGTVNISKNIANINDLITVTTQPNVGYTLVRIYYKLQDSDDEIIISDGSFIMPASNITIFAEFKKVDYTIAKSEMTNGDIEISLLGANLGEEINITPKPNLGYELDRLYYILQDDSEEIEIIDNTFIMPAGNLTVYATFKIIDYTITLDPAEGTLVGSRTINYTVESEDIVLEQPTREGYDFVGWSGTGLDGIVKNVTIQTGSTGDREYLANWEIKKFTIIWQNEDGEELKRDENVEYGTLPTYDGTPTKQSTAQYDYEFAGWEPEVVVATENATYKATYTPILRSYTIIFNNKNVTVMVDEQEINSGDKVEYGKTLNISYQETEGYHKTSFKVNDEEKESPCSIVVSGDVTISYSEEINVYTVTLPTGEGYTIESDGTIVNHGQSFRFRVVLNDGYTQSSVVVKSNNNEISIEEGYYTILNITENQIVTVEGVVLNTYTITWNNYDGTPLLQTEVIHGQKPTYTGETPTKQSNAQYDYEFAGWEPEVVVATENATYKATYTPILRSYTIIFNNKNVTVMVDEQEINSGDKVEYGKTLNISYQETEGYHKTSFKVNDEEKESPCSIVVSGDVTISYSEEINVYTVTLPTGEGYTIESDGTIVNHGQSFRFRVVLNDGYTQSSVVVKSNNNEISIEEGYYTILNITENQIVTVEGVVLNTYTITWNNYDGTPLLQTEVIHGQKPTYTGETPTKDKTEEFTYTFSDWDPKIVVATEDTTYTAQFIETRNSYTVTFNSNGGSEVENITKEYGSKIGTLPIPTFEGYDFVGWFTQLSGGEPINEMTLITTNITLYAHWVATSYNIDLNLDGGQISGDYKSTYTIEDENFVLPTPTKEGHNFLGWSKDGVGQPEVLVTVLKGTTGDLNYTAKWQINQYTYTFYRYQGGDILKQETVNYGTNIVAPTNVIRASDNVSGINYNFTGWNQEVPSTIGASNIEFYALYDEENFSAGLNFVYSGLDGYYIVDKGSTTETNIIVPSTYTTLENGKANVSEVAENGFSNMSDVTIITFNGEIEYIGAAAFANDDLLTNIIGLDQIYSIPESAFEGCSSLTSFNIGEKVIIIGTNAFANTGLTSVYIPSSVVSIENGAFENCYIENYSVSEDNLNYASYEGDLYNKNLTKLLLYANGKTANTFSVPSFVNEIENYAFGGENSLSRSLAKLSSNLQNIIIPDNVTILNDYSLNSALIVYTEFSNKPNGWSELSISQNEIYWNNEWEIQDNQPTIIIEASAFKTGVYQNWMSYISDETLFVDVVMPGSHDAGTKSITAENLHTQSSGFYDQLTGGVRYFDMRVAEYNEIVRCIHANSGDKIHDNNGTGIEFSTALNDMLRFVNENPSEIIILDFQHLWNDFEIQVVPMIEKSLSGKMLTKDKATNYSSLTMGQLRQWGVNFIVIAQDDSSQLSGVTSPNFDGHNWMYKRTENLRSEYERSTHISSASALIGIWPTYFNNFKEDQYNKIFVLQTQLTSGNGESNLVNREKSIRNDANKYFRGLKKNSTNLAKVNVIMRDFVVDDLDGVDSAQSGIQSVLFLNVYKNQIKSTEIERFKALIDFDTIDSW